MAPKKLATLGMFIIDQFEFRDALGNLTARTQPEQIGGGGTYCVVGARIWLPPADIGMIVDRGHDFPARIQESLDAFGPEMWLFRARRDGGCTTRAINLYKGENLRDFDYLTPKIRLTPTDLTDTPLAKPQHLHFVYSPARALEIMAQVSQVDGWNPVIIYEPIPDRCVPAELPALKDVLPSINILSPNAEESLSILGIPLPVTMDKIEQAAAALLFFGPKEAVVIRSGEKGAFTAHRDGRTQWVEAYWQSEDSSKIVDVTGAGNAFLGGLVAGLVISGGNILEATLYATVSASYTVEQEGLPLITSAASAGRELWNRDDPLNRLRLLKDRIAAKEHSG